MRLPQNTKGVNSVYRRKVPSRLGRRTPDFLLLSSATGLLIGVLTLLGQATLPDDVLQVSNSGAVWVVAAFVLGRFAPSRRVALSAGFIALIGELVGYFSAAPILAEASSSIGAMALWFMVALAAGPLFGWAGFDSRNGAGITRKLANAALGAAWLAIALFITLILNRTAAARVQGTLITTGLGIIFFGCMRLLGVIDTLRASIFSG